MYTNYTIKKLLIIFAAIALVACGGESGTDTVRQSAATPTNAISSADAVVERVATAGAQLLAVNKNLKGYALSTSIWPSGGFKVCWALGNDFFAATAQERQWVHEAFEETWGAHSNVTVSGWANQCLPNDRSFEGVRITVNDSQPLTSSLGTDMMSFWWRNFKDYDMVLNFAFQNYGSDPCGFSNNTKGCIKSVATHEFGHALGFSHEQNRTDTPQVCRDVESLGQPQGPDGDTFVGPWDSNSIMNYCNPKDLYDRTLSAGDIEMVQRYYGKPNNFAYVAKYAHGATIGSFNLKTGELRYPYISGADGLKTAMREPLLHKMLPSPDGKSIYLAVKNLKGGSEALRRIDSIKNVITDTATVAEQITDVQVSPDSKLLYVLYSTQSGNRGLRVFTADIKNVVADIAVPNARLLARPRTDNDSVYVLTVAGTAGAQTVAKVSIRNMAITRQFPAGSTGPGGSLAVDLSPDETQIYFMAHANAGDSSPKLARVWLSSGKFETLDGFTNGTDVTELQVIDANRILLANKTRGSGPDVYDLHTQATVSLMETNDGPLSFPYAFAPDTRAIYSMYNQEYEGQSYFSLCRFGLHVDGTYDGDDLEMIAFEVEPGELSRPFAIVNLD